MPAVTLAPFWSDDFDMDLLKLFPDVREILGDLADVKLWTFGHTTFVPEPMSGCWLWIGSTNAGGYGRIRIGRIARPATHVSLALAGRDIPPGILVLHRCDTPACVNPDHLWLGTQMDNMADMRAKRRQPSVAGEGNPRAKLTRIQVEDIRTIHSRGESIAALARLYDISESAIRFIVKGKHWRAA